MRTLLFKTLPQKAVAADYYFSKEIKLILLISFFFLGNVAFAQIKTSKLTGGRWSDASTWVEGSIPGPGDAVTIVAGSSVVIRTSTDNTILNGVLDPATCASLTVNGILTLGSGGGSGSKYLNVSDFVTINSGGTLTNDAVELHRLNVGGNFTNNGTFNPSIAPGFIQTTFNGAANQVIDGSSSTQAFYSFIVNKASGILSASANVTSLTVSSFTLTAGDFEAPASITSAGTVSLTAGTYTTGANTFIGGNFTNNGASFIPGTGTVTFNGAGTQTIGGSSTNLQFNNISTSGSNTLISGSVSGITTTINGNLLIGDGTTFQVARPLTVKGTTTIGNGTSGKLLISSVDGSKTFEGRVTVSAGGTWDNDDVNENARFYNGITNNGVFIAGSGLYNFEVNSQTIEGILTIPLIDVATGVTLTNNGTFTLSNDLAGQGSLVQGNNAILNIGGTSGIAVLSTAGANNTVNYTGAAQSVKGVPYVNLGLSGSGVKTLTTLTVTISGNLTLSETASAATVSNLAIGGNLSIGATAALTNGISRTLSVANSLSGNGTLTQSSNSILNINGSSTLTSISATAAGNSVNYNAASPSVIPGSYNNLTLNQSSGSAAIAGDVSVAGLLTLSTGNLVLGDYNLALASSATLSISSPSASRMIVASGTGELRRTFSATGSFVFPIGDNTSTLEYSPITVNVTSAAGFSSAYVGVSVVDAKHPSNSSATNFLSRYWNVTQSGITTCVATISGTYPSADINGTESSIKAAQLNGIFNQTTNPWIKYTSLTSSPLVVSGVTLTNGQTSAFTGITGADPTVTIGGDVSICSGGSFPLVSSVTGDPTILYSWSPATGLSAANVANPTATPTVTTDYTLTIIDGNGRSAVSSSKKITVNALPAEKAVSDPSTCIGTAVNITLTGSVSGVNYQLRLDSDDSNVGTVVAGTGGDITFSVNPSVTTTYNVLATTIATSCSLKMADKSTVTVNALPTVSAGSQVCIGSTITLSPATGGTWVSSDITKATVTNAGVVTGVAAGNVTFTFTNTTTGCSATTTSVAVNALPVVSAGSQVCIGSTITLSPSTGGTWVSSDDTKATVTNAGLVTGVAAGSVTFTFTNTATGCSATSTSVTVNSLPAEKVVSDPNTCTGAAVNIILSGSVSGVNYQLRLDSDDSNVGTTVAGTGGDITFSVNPSATTNYNILATTTSTSCSLEMTDKSTVTVNALPSTPTASATAQPTCTVSTGEITVNSSLTGLSFSIDGSDYSNTTGVFTGLGANDYTVTAKNVAGCISAPSSPITINVAIGAPTTPIASATLQPTCSVATGEITVSSSITGLSFSIDGSDYSNTTGVFTGLVANNYTVTAKNGAGCISASSVITINPQPATPAAPTLTSTQPTCSVATGEITISSSIAGLSFSINGSDYSNTTGVFTGLSANTYSVTAKNAAGCISAASSAITINPQPATPAAPTASATQPSCSVATGEITVTSSLTGLSFSIDGSDYTNTTGVFTGLVANTYSVTAKNAAGCISSPATAITINAQPATPATPTASITVQPSCAVPTGEITVSSSLVGLSFSINESDYSNTTGVFTGLTANDYTVTAKNVAGCISGATSTLTINAAIGAPQAPTASATAQPTCSLATGEITVSSNITDLSFSIDGSDYSNTTGVFTGLAAGDYTISAKNGSGCISPSSSVITINVQPALPSVSTSSTSLCIGATITASPGTDGSWVSNTPAVATISNAGLVTGISSGTVTFTFTSTATGCSATTSSVTVNALPTVSTSSATLCAGATMNASPASGGTWVSNNPGVATITNTGLVTGVSAGTVTFTYSSTATGCSSTTGTVTISPLPEKPVITASNVSTETPTLTSSSNSGNQWFKDNVAITAATSKTLTVSASGSYTVQVTANGCTSSVSDAVAIVITGIEQRIISDRSVIYPNPAKEAIQIDWSDFVSGAGIEVKIYDQVGRLIITKVMSSSDNSIDVRILEQGPYVFLARQNGTLLIQRFIKN